MRFIGTTARYCSGCKKETDHAIYENMGFLVRVCIRCRMKGDNKREGQTTTFMQQMILKF